MVYLNVAGLYPFQPDVQLAITTTLNQFGQLLYSESGIHYYRETLQRCRQHLAEWLNIEDNQQIAFVPNATTASWLILSRLMWERGDTILTTTHENSTVVKEIFALQAQGVVVHSFSSESQTDFVSQIEKSLRSKKVRAIVMSHVSHIDGRIFPLAPISQLARQHKTMLLIDGAQAVGHISVNFQDIPFDAYFFPGHKWCAGPMGTGALILGKELSLYKRILHQEGIDQSHSPWADFELGTQNIGLIAGFAKACTNKKEEGLQTTKLEKFRKEARQTISQLSSVRPLEWEGPHAPGILSFECLDETKAQALQKSVASTRLMAWKTFTLHTPLPPHTGIRLSWSHNTPVADLQAALTLIKHHFEAT